MTEKIKDTQSLADVLNLSPAAATELADQIALLLGETDIDVPELLKQAMTAPSKTTLSPAKRRVPGRFKGKFIVGPEFYQPLSIEDVRELNGE